jgi:hypothetical protein
VPEPIVSAKRAAHVERFLAEPIVATLTVSRERIYGHTAKLGAPEEFLGTLRRNEP